MTKEDVLLEELRELIVSSSREDCSVSLKSSRIEFAIENGLKSESFLVNKYAIYLLKSIAGSGAVERAGVGLGAVVVKGTVGRGTVGTAISTLFVTLYESIIDQSTDHLLVDNLEKFALICNCHHIKEDLGDDGDRFNQDELYWIAFNRLFKSTNTLSAHSRVLALLADRFFNLKDSRELKVFTRNSTCISGFMTLLQSVLSIQHLYTCCIREQGSFDSAFGLDVVRFIKEKIPIWYSRDCVRKLVSLVLSDFLPNCKSRVVAFYVLQGFIELAPAITDLVGGIASRQSILTTSSLSSLSSLFTSTLGASVYKPDSKPLLCSQITSLLYLYATPKSIEMAGVLQVLECLFGMDDISRETRSLYQYGHDDVYEGEVEEDEKSNRPSDHFIHWLCSEHEEWGLKEECKKYLLGHLHQLGFDADADAADTNFIIPPSTFVNHVVLLHQCSQRYNASNPLQPLHFDLSPLWTVSIAPPSTQPIEWHSLILPYFALASSILSSSYSSLSPILSASIKDVLLEYSTLFLQTALEYPQDIHTPLSIINILRVHIFLASPSSLYSLLTSSSSLSSSSSPSLKTFIHIQACRLSPLLQPPPLDIQTLYIPQPSLSHRIQNLHYETIHSLLPVSMETVTWALGVIPDLGIGSRSRSLWRFLGKCLDGLDRKDEDVLLDLDTLLGLMNSRFYELLIKIFHEEWKVSGWSLCVSTALQVLLHPLFLTASLSDPLLAESIKELLQAVDKWAVVRGRVKVTAAVLITTHMRRQLNKKNGALLLFEFVKEYKQVMVGLVVYGPVRSDLDDKISSMLSTPNKSNPLQPLAIEEEEDRGTAAWNFWNRDYVVRLCVNSLFLEFLDKKGSVAAVCKTADLIMRELVEYLMTSKDFKRQRFVDSEQQRKAVRAWQSLHLLFSFLVPSSEAVGDGVANDLLDFIVASTWTLLKREKCVETIYMIEWFLMRLLVTHPCQMFKFYQSWLDEIKDASAHCMSSLLIILYKGVSKLDLKEEVRDEYLTLGMDHALIWMSHKNYTVRVFAQLLLVECWRVLDSFSPLRVEFKHVGKLVDHLMASSDTQKTFKKTRGFFFYSPYFDPVSMVSVEFLFREWGEMVGTSEEERISSAAFLKILGSEYDCDGIVPLGHRDRLILRERVADSKRVDKCLQDEKKAVAASFEKENEKSGAAAGLPAALSLSPPPPSSSSSLQQTPLFSQRKILPWEKLMGSGIEIGALDKKEKPRNPIKIVASLLSKPANLGGLCRTAETFNAQELVVDSLSILQDPTFISLTVTSHLWMPISETKAPDLIPYLLEQKQLGYALIGLEQATNSTSLQSTVFPHRACLVLGREKEGLPPPILAIMDVIVEIPQFGVVKSLNVHVSASLCLWEYVKQQIENGQVV